MAAQLLKEAAVRTNDEAGDGTTTAVILTQALVREGLRNITAGAHPLAVSRGITSAAEIAVRSIKEQAKSVASGTELAHVAAISCQDKSAGQNLRSLNPSMTPTDCLPIC